MPQARWRKRLTRVLQSGPLLGASLLLTILVGARLRWLTLSASAFVHLFLCRCCWGELLVVHVCMTLVLSQPPAAVTTGLHLLAAATCTCSDLSAVPYAFCVCADPVCRLVPPGRGPQKHRPTVPGLLHLRYGEPSTPCSGWPNT